MLLQVCWLGLHHAFFRGFRVLSRGMWAHFLPGAWGGHLELSANALLTAGRVFSSGYLGGAWVCPNPWPWEPAWSPSRETLLHTQAVSPDTGLASRLRGVSDRHFLGTGGPPGGLRLTLGLLRRDVEWDWTLTTGLSSRGSISRACSAIEVLLVV